MELLLFLRLEHNFPKLYFSMFI